MSIRTEFRENRLLWLLAAVPALRTHRELFAGAQHGDEAKEDVWPIVVAATVLAVVTLLVVYLTFAMTLYLVPPVVK